MTDSRISNPIANGRRSWAKSSILRLLVAGLAALALSLVALIVLYRFVDPPASSLMATRWISGQKVQQTWVPIERISPHLIRAVIGNEDARFCRHWGVDWNAVEEAIEQAEEKGGHPRGASTIPMQLAKNLFLWPQRSYLRKAVEIPLAYTLTAVWPRRRMIEIYLNIAEWAPGVFGAEAAARHHFKKSASRLSRAQAARMAAALPNPYVRHAGRAGPKTRRLANLIERRTAKSPPDLRCIGPLK